MPLIKYNVTQTYLTNLKLTTENKNRMLPNDFE